MPLLAGCTLSDPTIDDPGATATPRHRRSAGYAALRPPVRRPPRPVGARAATTEQGLAGLAAAILAGPRRRAVEQDQRTLLRSVAPPPGPRDALDPSDRRPGWPSRRADAAAVAGPTGPARGRRGDRPPEAALAVSGLDALRFGSVSVAAAAYAAVVAAPTRHRWASRRPRGGPAAHRRRRPSRRSSPSCTPSSTATSWRSAGCRWPGEQHGQAVPSCAAPGPA